MLRTLTAALFGCSMLSVTANAQQCPAFPYTLANGNAADATQVMSDLNTLFNCGPLATNPHFTGNLGIGTSSPVVPLNLYSNGWDYQPQEQVTSVGGAGAGYIILEKARTGPAAVQNGDFLGTLLFQGYNGSSYQNGSYITGVVDNVPGGGTIPTAISFVTGPYETARIGSNGRVGIGISNPGYLLHVNGSVAGTSAYNNLSDIRLKKDITPIDNALATIEKLRGVHFRWRTAEERTVGKSFNLPVAEPQIGFVAQELKAVLPEAVTIADGPEAIMSVQESKVVPVLVEAMKELSAVNATLEVANQHNAAEITKLKTANDKYSAALARLEVELNALQRKAGIQTAQNLR